MTTQLRLWPKIRKTPTCWLWTAAVSSAGYGVVRHNNKCTLAHRYVYELMVGPIPRGMELDHKCHVRNCVAPWHLQVVTRQKNAENQRGARAHSKSGTRGVHWDKVNQKWRVSVMHFYRTYSGGRHASLAEAEAAAIALRNALMENNLRDRGLAHA